MLKKNWPGLCSLFYAYSVLAQNHIQYSNISYLKTDRNLQQISEIYGFKINDPVDGRDISQYRPVVDPAAISELKNDYFQNISMEECFTGKVVLDLASGGGGLVRQLHERGVDAHGLDLRAAPEGQQCLTSKPILKDIENNPFALLALQQGSITQMPYADETINIIISTWGPFSYFDGKIKSDFERTNHRELLERTLEEIKRVLKPQGVAIIGPIPELYYGQALKENSLSVAKSLLKDQAAFQVYRGRARSSNSSSLTTYMVITKGAMKPEQICEQIRL